MEEKKAEGKEGACGGGGCGLHCGCCVCKTVKGVVLLLIGGVVGYGIARCGGHRMCPMSATVSVQTESAPAPAATAAPKKAK